MENIIFIISVALVAFIFGLGIGSIVIINKTNLTL